jgi:hypothetical protein
MRQSAFEFGERHDVAFSPPRQRGEGRPLNG